MKNIITSLFLTTALSSFSFDYVVEGQIDKHDGAKIMMLDYNGNVEIDSARVENGRFRFEELMKFLPT